MVVAALVACLAAFAIAGPARAAACPGVSPDLTAALDRVAAACPHALCGRAIAAPAFAATAPACPRGDWADLLAAIAATLDADGFVLLGEIHDNGLHHVLRAPLVGHPREAATTAIVMEQFRADQQATLVPTAPAAPAATFEAFLERIDWARSPWSRTADYRPLLAAVFASGRPLHAADPTREAMRASAREGAAGVAADLRARLGLDVPLGVAQDTASLAEIEGSHCGLMPKSALPGMAYAQRFRDAHMADVMVRAATGRGAVLIAGNGHVRRDRGVPWYLVRRAPGRPVLTVLLVEVEEGERSTDPAAYVPRDEAGAPAVDWVVFTPRAERGDPCVEMRAAFEAISKQKDKREP
jgi:uncharacterized iron-regulated protein